MVEKIREEGEKWVIKQEEGILIYLFLSPLKKSRYRRVKKIDLLVFSFSFSL